MATFKINDFNGLRSSVVWLQIDAQEYRVEIYYEDPRLEHLSRVYSPTSFPAANAQFLRCVEAAIVHETAITTQCLTGNWEAAYEGWMEAQAEQDRVVRQALKEELKSRM